MLQLRFSAHRTYFIIFPFVRLVVFQHVLVGLATCLRAWRHRVQGVTGDRAVTGHAQNSRRAPSTAALRWAVTGHANETPPRGTFSPPSVFSPPSSPPSSPLISSPLLLSPRGNSMTCGVLPTSTLLSNRQTLPPGQAPAHCLVVEVFVFSLCRFCCCSCASQRTGPILLYFHLFVWSFSNMCLWVSPRACAPGATESRGLWGCSFKWISGVDLLSGSLGLPF